MRSPPRDPVRRHTRGHSAPGRALGDGAVVTVCVAVAALLRIGTLAAKPPWTDEFATMVFSLGHSFRVIPLDRVITAAELLAPVHYPPGPWRHVLASLFTESNHPPLYFVLAHAWWHLFPPGADGIASLVVARALPALFGVAAVPAIYLLGRLAFRSRAAGRWGAACMAVSPFGVYLSQEARHYAPAVLALVISLAASVVVVRAVLGSAESAMRPRLPRWAAPTWVAANVLGVATHYFVAIALAAQAGAVLAVCAAHVGWRRALLLRVPHRATLVAIVLLTAAGAAVWWPAWSNTDPAPLVEWARLDRASPLDWLRPPYQLLAGLVPMMIVLPVEGVPRSVVVVSALTALAFAVWVLPVLRRAYHGVAAHDPAATRLIAGTAGGGVAALLAITYTAGIDLTRAPRYSFVYFPALVAVLGASLARAWASGRRAVPLAVLAAGALGSLTVGANLAFRKIDETERTVLAALASARAPALVVTARPHHGADGRMMGIAWPFRSRLARAPRFLLATGAVGGCPIADCPATRAVTTALARIDRPVDLWLVNLAPAARIDSLAPPLAALGCHRSATVLPSVAGVRYAKFECR